MHQTIAAHPATKLADKAAPTFIARVRSELLRMLAGMAARR